MMRLHAFAAALLLACACWCSHRQGSRPAGDSAGVPGRSASATAVAPATEASPLAGQLGEKLHPSSQLPGEIGASTSTVEGCLTSSSEEGGRQHPASVATRAGADVEVQRSPGGLLVIHRLAHACCLTGAVGSRVERDAVSIVVTLTGNPCRCMCGSTLRTAVRLAPGRYRLAVVVAHEETPYGGKQERVVERTIDVK
jgi:hypothetical protein